MPIINFTNPIAVLLGVILFVLILYLAKEVKKSWIIGIMLFVFHMFFPADASNHALLMVNTVPDAVYVAPPGTSKSHTMSGTVLLSPVW